MLWARKFRSSLVLLAFLLWYLCGLTIVLSFGFKMSKCFVSRLSFWFTRLVSSDYCESKLVLYLWCFLMHVKKVTYYGTNLATASTGKARGEPYFEPYFPEGEVSRGPRTALQCPTLAPPPASFIHLSYVYTPLIRLGRQHES